MSGNGDDGLIEDRPSPAFRRFFAWYATRLVSRRFHALRLLKGSREILEEALDADRSMITLISHVSWWDPLVGLVLWRKLFVGRDILMPMASEQLSRFRFFRRLGVFGIDPDDPTSMGQMRRHVLQRLAQSPDTILGLTPQGRFTDPREPIRLRPGAAAIAAACERSPSVVVISIEYVFWQDARPELLVAVRSCDSPEAGSTTDWNRAMEEGMRRCAKDLAAASIARDESAFEVLEGGKDRINPFMDPWLRIRGRSGGIAATRAAPKGSA